MIGYVARNENGSLWLHTEKPELVYGLKEYYSENFFQIQDDMFPEFKDVTFNDGPVEVEFNIKLK